MKKFCRGYAENSFLKKEQPMITYEFLDDQPITPHSAKEINELLAQLTASPTPITASDLESIARHSALLVARDEQQSVKGIATLCIIHAPTGIKGLIEDVVVDASLCGRGVGTALMVKLITEAKRRGVGKLELTSNPKREIANRLYQKLGFELRETNHYRMAL